MAKSKGIKKANKTAAMTTTNTSVQSPVVWILGISAVLLIVVVILTFKKKSQAAPKLPQDVGKPISTSDEKSNIKDKDTAPMLEIQESPGKKKYNKFINWATSFLLFT